MNQEKFVHDNCVTNVFLIPVIMKRVTGVSNMEIGIVKHIMERKRSVKSVWHTDFLLGMI
jgi:hypothetical protein